MSIPFERLEAEVRACRICELDLPLGANPVFQLHPQAWLLIVGQAPGQKVHKTGVPWDDQSGNKLRDWLGIDKKTFYDARQVAILPMGFCYPGKGSGGDLPPRPECAAHWHQKLLARLESIRLTLVIGQYAQTYCLGARRRENLTDTVRHWQDYLPHHFPLPHPSPRNRFWLQRNPWFEAQVLPALRQRVEKCRTTEV